MHICYFFRIFATAMIQINKLSVNFTGDYLFKDISFVAGDKDRIGLVGKNGAGKSTLLKIIHKELEPESGAENGSQRILDAFPEFVEHGRFVDVGGQEVDRILSLQELLYETGLPYPAATGEQDQVRVAGIRFFEQSHLVGPADELFHESS